MRYSTTAIVLAAMTVGEAVAGPTHAHLHRKAHEKKDVDWAALDWADMDVNWAAAYSSGLAEKAGATAAAVAPAVTTVAAAVAPAVTTAAAAAVPTTTSASSAVADVKSDVESGVESLFAGVVGVANSLTSFGGSSNPSGSAGDFYIGEVGSPYGTNIIKVDSIDGYDFTNTFTNSQSSAITINIWNKVGHDGQPLSGSALAPKSTTLTFALAPGKSQVVAFMENSQVGWAQAVSETAASGAFATSWGEANFLSAGSGYDLSAIMNPSGNNYKMSISSVEAPACTSDQTQNFWLTATDPVGGSDGSCFIAQSTAHLTTVMGGTF
ncbi:hypothetical protein D0Z07_1999 [Hyphodiscus hymeniophilus]|uniref:Allergen Asp f 4 n=1 Tax=Hyphodiscus hymeniophilus TaxID=353542 RepID=A0A9P6VN14_9HELO|nr:hypothetical protein D0Z07_1999 [Hyphodiscus hymeniophilus]